MIVDFLLTSNYTHVQTLHYQIENIYLSAEIFKTYLPEYLQVSLH